MGKNVPIMAEHGAALAKCAKKSVRVLVVANPACTNCLVVSRSYVVVRGGGGMLVVVVVAVTAAAVVVMVWILMR